MSPARPPRLLSIAGSDSGGGAGIQADLKTFAALGAYGMTAITAVTAQNTVGVSAIHALPADMVTAQIDAVASDIGVDAAKTGMLGGAAIVEAVALSVRRHRIAHLIVDPVMVATSGDPLCDRDTMHAMITLLLPCATLVTPNLPEASWLLGRNITTRDQMHAAANDLLRLGCRAVLLKGGHLPGGELHDLLVTTDGTASEFSHPRINTRNLHGTGCTLSAAIAVFLAQGLALPDAVRSGRDYVLQAIATGARFSYGQGCGPLGQVKSKAD